MLLRKSIAVPIILILIIISTGTLFVGYMINIDDLETAMKAREIDKAKNIHNIIDYRIKKEISDLKASLRLIKTHNEFHSAAINYFISGNIAPLKKVMDNIYPNLNTDIFLVTDEKGIVVYRANDPKKRGDSHAGIWGFDEAISGEDIVSASKGPRGWAVRALTPISSGSKNYGVIILGKRIDDNFAKKIYEETETHVSFGTLNGVVSSSLPQEQRKFHDNKIIEKSLLEKKTFFIEDKNNQKNIMYSPLTVVDESFGLIVQTDMSPVYNLLAASKKNLLKCYLVVLSAVIMSGIMLTFYLIRPLRSLRERSREIIKKFSGNEPEQKKDSNEIETSVHAFDVMVETIEKHIEKRKKAEKEIILAKEDWENTFNAVPDLIAIIDTGYIITRVNKSLADRSGMNPEKLIGLPCYRCICGNPAPPPNCPHEQMMSDGREHSAEMHIEHLGGDYFITASPLKDANGLLTGCVHVARDVTFIKTAQEEIESGQKFLQSIIDGVTDSIIVLGTDYQVKLMNKAARRFSVGDSAFESPLYCYQVNHKSDRPCSGADEACPVSAVLKTKMPIAVIHTHTNKDGARSKFEVLASPVFDENGDVVQIIETSRDITNRLILEDAKRKLDERIMLEQKEQSIVTLAGGIAHDFNNILMGMLGNAELLNLDFSPEDKHREYTGNIIASVERMAGLTKQLLAYAKTGIYQPKAVFINSHIKEVLNLAYKGQAMNIEVILDLSDDLSPVFADPGQINQVLISLFNNAFEAMEKSNGKLFVQTSNDLNKAAWECQLFRHEHPAGDYVHIRISDTGPGIPRNMLKRIFEPFYTTKFMGRGLDLAAVSGIILRHNGCISVDSELGKGTIFDIYLPCAKDLPEDIKPIAVQPLTETKAGTILIADDEPQILSLLTDILTRMGYKVLKAMDGIEAFEIFKKEKEKIKLAILDIQMPRMDGKRLFMEIKALNPDARVLISTGYDEKTATEGIGENQPDGFIQKPYKASVLREKVRELLGEQGADI